MKVISIIYIILLAVALTGCSARTEPPNTNASEVSTVETEPAEQVKTCLVETEVPETTQITSETQIEQLKSITEFELLEEVQPTETTVANTQTDTPADSPTETDVSPTETDVSPTETDVPPTETDVSPTETEPTPDATEETEAPAETDPPQTYGGLSDADINRIATVVYGEVGSMCGTITLTYSDSSKVSVSGDTIRMMHALVVVNQYRSAKFPSTVSGCIRTYWSSDYDNPYWQSSSKWQNCRQAVINALCGGVYLPSNVFGATQDASFGSRYPGYWKYARVDWNTGWTSGVFYYYAYG